jgi:hypothetical protein
MGRLITGLAGLSVSFWGLFEDVGFIAQPFYAYAWWSYILALDGFVALRRKGSLLTTRRSLLGPIVVWSVTFWFLFELLNLRFQNWYYVGVFARGEGADLIRGPLFGVLSFATVFTGLFESYDALSSFGLFRGWKTRPRALPRWTSFAIQGFGALLVVLALAWSRYLAPLIWGSVSYLLDPWNYRKGARSLLREVEAGELGTIARMLASGLLCGIVWESFNYFSPQKWIYTVRGLDELKLFEMPLLGFLGFPALALDAFAFFAFTSYWFHGNRTWENPEDVSQKLEARTPLGPRAFLRTLPLHALFWTAVALLMEGANVGSIELTLEDLPSLTASDVRKLREAGIERPRQLLGALDDPEDRPRIERALSLPAAALEALREETRLLEFKGIGHHHGALLAEAGIRSVDDLARADPDELYEILERERGGHGFPALRSEMVRVWVQSARSRDGLHSAR